MGNRQPRPQLLKLTMGVILFVVMIVALGLAGWNFHAVHDEIRRFLPSKFGPLDQRWAVGYYVWDPQTSDTARQRYIAMYLWMALAMLCLGLMVLLSGNWLGAALFFGLAIFAVAAVSWEVHRYDKARGR
jgi:hypothetical protein